MRSLLAVLLLAPACSGRPLPLPTDTLPTDLARANLDAGTLPDLARPVQDGGDGGDVSGCRLTFEVKQSGAWPMQQTDVAAGDFDGDGVMDFVTLDWGYAVGMEVVHSQLALFIGRGDGTFDEPRLFALKPGSQTMTAADFDEDGRMDVAIAAELAPATLEIQVWHGRRDRTLAPIYSMTTSGDRYRPALAGGDVNGDGHRDLVVGNASGLRTLLGDGRGGFSTVFAMPGYWYLAALALHDLDGDHRSDLIALLENGVVQLFPSLSDGTFGPPVTVNADAYGAYPLSIEVADLNGDGVVDLLADEVVGNPNGSGTVATQLRFLAGTGGGSFASGVALLDDHGQPLSSRHSRLVVDLDGDGVPELVGLGWETSATEVARGSVAGNYRLQQLPATLAEALTAADFDRDGRSDLIKIGPASWQLLHSLSSGNVEPGPTHGTNLVTGLSLVDVDGDGRLDLVTGDAAEIGLAIRPLAADGTPGPLSTPAALGPSSGFCVGDFDGDGRTDWVGDGSHYSWIQPGWTLARENAGAFTLDPITAPQSSFCFAAGDFDGDGHPDLLASVWGDYSGHLYWLRGDGRGGFAPAADAGIAAAGTGVLTDDVDGDGHADLTWMLSDLEVAHGHGDGTFDPPQHYGVGSLTADYDPAALAAADLDGDGRRDLIVGDAAKSSLMVLLGGPGGTAVSYALGDWPRAVAVGDLDGDGTLDVVAVVGAGAAWLRGRGDGTLEPPRVVPLPGESAGPVAIADLDGDGRRDVVVVGRQSNVASVLKNICR
jgi:hypothetical protein